MKEILQEILREMEHNLNHWDESVFPARRVCFPSCFKCRLEALLSKYELEVSEAKITGRVKGE